MSPLRNTDILCFSTTDWDAQFGSRQEIMERLASRNRVLFVEPPRNLLNYGRFQEFNGQRAYIKEAFTGKLRRLNKSLWVYTPGIVVPGGLRPVTNFIGYRLVLRQKVKRVMKDIGFDKVLMWIYPVPCAGIIGCFNEKLRVYHCIDEYTELASSVSSSARIWNVERQLIEKCDIVFASSRSIYEKRRHLNPRTYYLPSAVDFNAFSGGSVRAKPDDMVSNAGRPVVGMVGTIDDRVDFSLLEGVIKTNSDKDFVIIGNILEHVTTKAQALMECKNVFFLGRKPKNALPGYLGHMDVCIIPYIINEFTKGISPLKLYEYMAAGRPVISTPLPEAKELGDMVYIAPDREGFHSAIGRALSEAGVMRDRRMRFASMNTWDSRVAFIEDALGGLI